MESIIIHPQSQKELKAIQSILQALEMPFEKLKIKPLAINPSPSGDTWFDNPNNLAMVEKGLEDFKAGKVVELTPELQKKLLGL